jgi:hypothetical protein
MHSNKQKIFLYLQILRERALRGNTLDQLPACPPSVTHKSTVSEGSSLTYTQNAHIMKCMHSVLEKS